MPDSVIEWPALVKFRNDDELVRVADAAQWHALRRESHGAELLVDAEGAIYALAFTQNGLDAVPTGEQASLGRVLALVRAHAARQGDCCVAKFHAGSIREAIAAIMEE